MYISYIKFKFIIGQRIVQLYINYHNRCEKQMYEIKRNAQKRRVIKLNIIYFIAVLSFKDLLYKRIVCYNQNY